MREPILLEKELVRNSLLLESRHALIKLLVSNRDMGSSPAPDANPDIGI